MFTFMEWFLLNEAQDYRHFIKNNKQQIILFFSASRGKNTWKYSDIKTILLWGLITECTFSSVCQNIKCSAYRVFLSVENENENI